MIRFNDVSKKYKNGTLALKPFSLELEKGRCIGILGPNGSGKTTLLKLLQGYLKPTTGTVDIDGVEIGPETKSKVSYLPDVPFIPNDYTVKEAKKLWMTFFDDFSESKFRDLLRFMNLDEDMKIGDMSKGMNEKFHLSLILARDAEIFVIDEPIAGVDLVSRDKILEAIFTNIDKDKTLIITTHLVDEMETLFDDILFIANGEIVLSGNAEKLRQEHNMQISDIFRDIFGKISY